MTRPTLLALVLVATTGCSFTEYAPASGTPAVPVGARTAAYQSLSAHGELRVLSLGVETLADDDETLKIPAVHVRVLAEDISQAPWALDVRAQRLVLAGHGAEVPAYATADRAGHLPPVVDLPVGVVRTVDLYYPLPKDMDSSGKLPSFAVVTKLATDAGVVEQTTPFQRVEVGYGTRMAIQQNDIDEAQAEATLDADNDWTNLAFVGFDGVQPAWEPIALHRMPIIPVDAYPTTGRTWSRGARHGSAASKDRSGKPAEGHKR